MVTANVVKPLNVKVTFIAEAAPKAKSCWDRKREETVVTAEVLRAVQAWYYSCEES